MVLLYINNLVFFCVCNLFPKLPKAKLKAFLGEEGGYKCIPLYLNDDLFKESNYFPQWLHIGWH